MSYIVSGLDFLVPKGTKVETISDSYRIPSGTDLLRASQEVPIPRDYVPLDLAALHYRISLTDKLGIHLVYVKLTRLGLKITKYSDKGLHALTHVLKNKITDLFLFEGELYLPYTFFLPRSFSGVIKVTYNTEENNSFSYLTYDQINYILVNES